MAKKDFYIPKIEVDSSKKKTENQAESEKRRNQERFVSPYYGPNVKDVLTYPFVKYGNRGSQYEGLRDKPLVPEEKVIQKYGTKYHEFKQIQGIREDARLAEIITEEEFTSSGGPENWEDELGRLEDLPPLDDEYDFYGKTIYSGNDSDTAPEFVPSGRRNFNSEQRYTGYNTRRENPIFPERRPSQKYVAPPQTLLKRDQSARTSDYTSVNFQKEIIDRTLRDFRIGGHVVHFTKGPTVTQFEIKLDAGVKVERVKNIARNLQMNLEGKSIRIEAPIPGKSTIGIEVPNIEQEKVLFGDLMTRPEFLNDGNPLNVALGIDIGGDFITLDITQMPHALIAGTTGSGKSVCIHSIINSMIFKSTPEEVRLVLIDPKLIEFTSYEDIPHLATPVINDPKLATTALKWAVDEMQNRYELFKACRRRDISSYNELAEEDPNLRKLPFIVIIIDELADLMFVASSSVEEYIQRLAQKARAAGIHLIMATQRPSTDIIKGPIKANIPTRIAFALNSQVDSMTILDKSGADKLLGKGDMLYSDGVNEIRVQGAYISLEEIMAITDYLRQKYGPDFLFSKEDLTEKMQYEEALGSDPRSDEYFEVIAQYVVENNNASINRIQKRFGIGFNRAQNIMMGLEELGIVSEGMAGKPRTVLVTLEELEDILNQ
ncbi:MAG TPA: DNA translocase FtsK [Acholeplasmataceae bacterium]|nr:DNA translocase FtsK [Acholeplasmataceae bacterium]